MCSTMIYRYTQFYFPAHRCCMQITITIGAPALTHGPGINKNRGVHAEMYHQSGLVISREQGLRYDAGFAVPVLMS